MTVTPAGLWRVSAAEVAEAIPARPASGLEVIGPRYREDLCLDAAAAIEQRLGVITPIDPRPT